MVPILQLHPLTESEKERAPGSFLRIFLSDGLKPEIRPETERDPLELANRLIAGGYKQRDKDRVAAASRRSSSSEHQRQDASATFKKFSYEEIVARDKANLDIFWLKDDSLEDSDNLPAPALLAAEIVESLEAALTEFRAVEESLGVKEG